MTSLFLFLAITVILFTSPIIFENAFAADKPTKLQKECAKEKDPSKIKPECELLNLINANKPHPQSDSFFDVFTELGFTADSFFDIFTELQRAIGDPDFDLLRNGISDFDNEVAARMAADSQLQNNIDSFFDVFVEVDLPSCSDGQVIKRDSLSPTGWICASDEIGSGGTIPSQSCPANHYVSGIDSAGSLICTALPNSSPPLDCTRHGPNVDLHGCDLSGRDFTGLDLSGANLSGANLRHAILPGANLRGAILTDADLSGAILTDADLSGANLSGAILTDADLSGAFLHGAILTDANLSGANLSDAIIPVANLTNAILTNSILTGTDLTNSILSGADLTNANLSDALLYGVDFSGANLFSAILSVADLSNANLTNADLTGADLSDAYLSGANLSGAILSGASLQFAEFTGAINQPTGAIDCIGTPIGATFTCTG